MARGMGRANIDDVVLIDRLVGRRHDVCFVVGKGRRLPEYFKALIYFRGGGGLAFAESEYVADLLKAAGQSFGILYLDSGLPEDERERILGYSDFGFAEVILVDFD